MSGVALVVHMCAVLLMFASVVTAPHALFAELQPEIAVLQLGFEVVVFTYVFIH